MQLEIVSTLAAFASLNSSAYAKTDWKKETEQGVQPSHYVVYIDTTDLIHRYRNSWDDVVTSLVLDLSRKDAKTAEPNKIQI
ncbi:MAG: hypothetical protein IJE74_07630 [Clostridia bacterium]|nr:hypothetical protein [Clostridia bacterium]